MRSGRSRREGCGRRGASLGSATNTTMQMGNAMKAMQVALAAGAVALLASATQASAQNMMGYGQKNRDKSGQPQYIPPTKAQEKIFPLERPNGCGLSPDEKTLYVVETPTARCWAFELSSPGTIKDANGPYRGEKGRVIAGLGGYQMFDSLAVDSAGHVCVATLITGAVSDISPDGKTVVQFKLPDPMVTNVCFGGADMRTAYATLSMTGNPATLIEPTQLPIHPTSCQPVYPHNHLRVNTIFEVARTAGAPEVVNSATGDLHRQLHDRLVAIAGRGRGLGHGEPVVGGEVDDVQEEARAGDMA